jgi:ketosteroid isomerase-like protein
MPSDTDQILDLGKRWVAAELAADVATLEGIVTADFRLVGPFGFVLDRQQWLDRYRSGDLSTSALEWHDVDVRIHGDAAVTIGTQTQQAAYRGSPSDGAFRITHIFVKQDGGWKVLGMHLSLSELPMPPASSGDA